MFVPAIYRPGEPGWAEDLVRRHPLALLVTVEDGVPLATHVPVIHEPGEPGSGGETGLVGTTFVGHLNRANPHWAALRRASDSLLVFRGAESYVSPTVYGVTPAAPTWNFVAVHARGTVETVEDEAGRMDVLTRTVDTFERELGTGWERGDSMAYFEQLAPGVGAFRVRVTEADGMFKLSQEKPPEIRRRVAAAFGDAPSGRDRSVAEAMARYGGSAP